MKRPLIVANWKCNPTTLEEAKQLFNSVNDGIRNIKGVEIVVCPPFVYLANIRHLKSNIHFGAQDVFWEEKGAFTGGISPAMLRDLGVEYVIIGHSERRRYFNETDEMINKKIEAALKKKLKPILCIGETEIERKTGRTFDVLKRQLRNDLKSIFNLKSKILNLTIAYEPVWAIGTGKACSIPEAKAVNLFIRKMIKSFPIIYGGSINSQNANDFVEKAEFQGFIIGSASLNSEEFIKLVKNIDLIS